MYLNFFTDIHFFVRPADWVHSSVIYKIGARQIGFEGETWVTVLGWVTEGETWDDTMNLLWRISWLSYQLQILQRINEHLILFVKPIIRWDFFQFTFFVGSFSGQTLDLQKQESSVKKIPRFVDKNHFEPFLSREWFPFINTHVSTLMTKHVMSLMSLILYYYYYSFFNAFSGLMDRLYKNGSVSEIGA